MNFQRLLIPLRTPVGFVLRKYTTQNLGKNLLSVKKIRIEQGTFLYLLISIYIHGETLFARTIMRGMQGKEHGKLYDSVKGEMERLGLCTRALGGGFMDLNPVAKTIEIYGECATYGRANHHISKEMLLESKEYQNFQIKVEK